MCNQFRIVRVTVHVNKPEASHEYSQQTSHHQVAPSGGLIRNQAISINNLEINNTPARELANHALTLAYEGCQYHTQTQTRTRLYVCVCVCVCVYVYSTLHRTWEVVS